ncbi:MAG: LysE family translocator [Magnetospiraceae bacterium]
MSLELWIAFVIASSVLLIVPGPTVMLVVSYALGRGRSSGWWTVPGVTLGDFTAMTASLIGAGAVLATSATLFTALKLCGAAYLIYLGVKLWQSRPQLDPIKARQNGHHPRLMFINAYVVTALNPKSIVFFVAFLPQFVDPGAPVFQQFVILEATFLVLAAANVAVWAVLAGKFREKFSRPSTLKTVNRIGGSFLIGAGLLTAAIRRS